MIRVLHSLGGLDRGGIETFIMNVYRTINRDEIQFDFLVSNGGDYESEIIELGGRIYKIPPRNKGFFSYSKNLESFFREHKGEFAALHVHSASLSSVAPLVYAKKYGIKIRIIHSHSSTIKTSKLHYLLHYANKLRIGKLATHFFACSDKASKWFYSYTSVSKKCLIIRNGVNTDDFTFSPELRTQIRQRLGINENDFVAGHVGSMIKVKNHVFLIQVFKAIHDLRPSSKLLLIGTGPLKEDIQRQISDLELSNNVVLLGNRADVNELLQAIDVIVMPSLFEGMPVSLVEAQAAGCFVVCSDTISKDTKIINSFYQLPLSENPKQWAEKIIALDRSFKRKDTGIDIQKNGFDIKAITDNLSSIYIDNSNK